MADIRRDQVETMVRGMEIMRGYRMSYRATYHMLRRIHSPYYAAQLIRILISLRDAAVAYQSLVEQTRKFNI